MTIEVQSDDSNLRSEVEVEFQPEDSDNPQSDDANDSDEQLEKVHGYAAPDEDDSLRTEPELQGFDPSYNPQHQSGGFEPPSSSSFKDFIDRLVVRLKLSCPAAILLELDLSFLTKKAVNTVRTSDSPSHESIAYAKETVAKYLTLELNELDHLQIRSLKSALTVLAFACQSEDKKDLLTSLASKLSTYYDQLSCDTDEFPSLERELHTYMKPVHELKLIGEEAEVRAAMDILKKAAYEEEEKFMLDLEAKMIASRSRLQKLDEERAELASQQNKAFNEIEVRKAKLKAQRSEVAIWVKRKEEISARRTSMTQAWWEMKTIDLSLIP